MSESSEKFDEVSVDEVSVDEVSADVSSPAMNNGGKRLWRSIDELNQSPEFLDRVRAEFPDTVDNWTVESPETATPEDLATADLSRRTFLGVMGASMALLGISGCSTRQPDQKIVPYVNQPEFLVPGRPLFFASHFCIDGYAHGTLVEQHEGRPTKIEGNPDHPASLGATNIFMQASILQMYEPERIQAVADRGSMTRWSNFSAAAEKWMADKASTGGAGLRILAEPSTSPTLARQVAAFKKKYPQARWHTYSPTHRNNAMAGAKTAFGKPMLPVYHFDKADVILSLDSDFLTDEPGSVVYARKYIDGRRVRKDRTQMNRLYVLESTKSITGAAADHRLPLSPSAISEFAVKLASAVGIVGANGSTPAGVSDVFINELVKDLRSAGNRAMVIVGESQPASIHAMVHAINAMLTAAGNTVTYIDSPEIDPVDTVDSIKSLTTDMNAGHVDTLLIFGGNPVYNAPVDFGFAKAMEMVATCVHLTMFDNETTFLCHWHLPLSHELEQWSDARAFDGTVSIGQPLIAPLYSSKSVYEVMAILLGDASRTNYDLIRATWAEENKDAAKLEASWVNWLRDGVMKGSAAAPSRVNLIAARGSFPTTQHAPITGEGKVTVVIRPDPAVGDGTWSHSAWLQELPKPVTKLTWDNAALMSYATAKKHGLEKESVVDLAANGRSIGRVPVLPVPGLPDDVITIHLGYGRERAGEVGTKIGFNAYAIRASDTPWTIENVDMEKLTGSYKLAITQETQLMHGRDLYKIKDISKYGKAEGETVGDSPDGAQIESHSAPAEARTVPLNLYQNWDYTKGNQWGMVIDNNACIGCNACVVGCMSENNIPTVGKDQIIKGRQMHWLRIDTYFQSEGKEVNDEVASENPDTYFQPVACQHCENAPCELVCPVGATVHDVEGTNNMVYNRCVGTRYCSNNCPYKVRRFNWLSYNWTIPESIRLMKNPDVTIRNRGIMEKCSYCIQRISHARIDAKKADRPIADGEVVTACQQACPTNAIFFGNTLDKSSEVAKLKTEPENWSLLEELNTVPRTTYMTRFKNVNPAMKA